MKIHYTLKEEDMLEMQLFMASQSSSYIKRRRHETIFLVAISIFCGIGYFMKEKQIDALIYWGTFAILCGICFPYYFNWKHKKDCLKKIKATYFEKPVYLEITETYIYTIQNEIDAQVKLSEIEKVIETPGLFILCSLNGAMLAIPKDNTDVNQLRDYLCSLRLIIEDHEDHLNWKW